jgi:hypothetical protein
MKDHTTSRTIHYQHLAVMLVMSFVAMYLLMYAMTDRFDDVFMSLNQVYMAGLMTAPMAVIELSRCNLEVTLIQPLVETQCGRYWPHAGAMKSRLLRSGSQCVNESPALSAWHRQLPRSFVERCQLCS